MCAKESTSFIFSVNNPPCGLCTWKRHCFGDVGNAQQNINAPRQLVPSDNRLRLSSLSLFAECKNQVEQRKINSPKAWGPKPKQNGFQGVGIRYRKEECPCKDCIRTWSANMWRLKWLSGRIAHLWKLWFKTLSDKCWIKNTGIVILLLDPLEGCVFSKTSPHKQMVNGTGLCIFCLSPHTRTYTHPAQCRLEWYEPCFV